MLEFLSTFLSTQPWFVQVGFWIGAFRVVFKPIMLGVQNFVDLTPTKKDDEILHDIISHPIYRAIAVALDYLVSIKVPVAIEKKNA